MKPLHPTFGPDGLVPIIAQDAATGAVLMLAYGNEASLERTMQTGQMTYWSRSRQELWTKGSTSGNTQTLVSWELDCDGDAILALVEQTGPACHTGAPTCWGEPAAGLLALDALAKSRLQVPGNSYTDQLLADPVFAASKIVEEANEVATVLRGEDNEDTLSHEAADLLYHLCMGLAASGEDLVAALHELRRRAR